MRYAIIGSEDIAELEQRIQGFCLEGWEPLGGIAVATWEHTGRDGKERAFWFLQAIIHRGDF